jgi:DNA-binding MarR family transcriptional regulator
MQTMELSTMEALNLWQRVLTSAMDELSFDLSTRQQAILMTVYLEQGPHTIKSLSSKLNISKAAICRAIDALSLDGLVRRKKDENDKRNVFIQRTVNGSVFLSDFADIISKEAEKHQEEAEEPAVLAA